MYKGSKFNIKYFEIKKAFTLIELLLVIAIIASLVGLILAALNPAQRLNDANDAKYETNAAEIKKAIQSYVLAHQGSFPPSISSLAYGYYDICKEGQSTGCVNLDILKTNGYLSSIPVDPNGATSVLSGFKLKFEAAKSFVYVYSNDEYWAMLNRGTTFTDGLVGYWKMDESSWGSVLDSSGNGNNGTASGGTTITAGNFGNAGNFNGTGNWVDLGTNKSLLRNVKNATLSAWIKVNDDSDQKDIITVSRNGASSSCRACININSSEQVVVGGRSADGDSFQSVITTSSLTLGAWYHVLGVLDYTNDQIYIYINGTQVATTGSVNFSVSTTANTTEDTVEIGSDSRGSVTNAFNGVIDDVRIYNRTLNANEVLALYNFGAPPVLHWRFDETADTTAADTSINAMHGTLTAGPTWVSGKYGNAVDLDGVDDYVNLADPANGLLDFVDGRDFTMEAWIKTPDSPSARTVLIKKTSNVATNAGFLLQLFAGEGIGVYTADGVEQNLTSGNTPVPIDTWTHIAVVYDDNTAVTIYMNGEDITGNSAQSAISLVDSLANTTQFRVGAESGTPQLFFTGSIDDVRIYNYVRTQPQIIKDMNDQ